MKAILLCILICCTLSPLIAQEELGITLNSESWSFEFDGGIIVNICVEGGMRRDMESRRVRITDLRSAIKVRVENKNYYYIIEGNPRLEGRRTFITQGVIFEKIGDEYDLTFPAPDDAIKVKVSEKTHADFLKAVSASLKAATAMMESWQSTKEAFDNAIK